MNNISIALGGLLRSRKFWLWLFVLAFTGVYAVLFDPSAAPRFWEVLQYGATAIAGLTTLEDVAAKLGVKVPPPTETK